MQDRINKNKPLKRVTENPRLSYTHEHSDYICTYSCLDGTELALPLDIATYKLAPCFPRDRPDAAEDAQIPNESFELTIPKYCVVYQNVASSRALMTLVSANALLDRTGETLLRCPEDARTIAFPPSVRETDGRALCDLARLRSVSMNDGMTRFREAFKRARNGAGIVQIAPFQNTRPKRVRLSPAMRVLGPVLRDCSTVISIVIPNGIEEIGEQSFCGCGATRLALPDSVRAIRREAFARSRLEGFAAPKELRVLAHGAFSGCSRLKRVELNDGLEVIGTPGETGAGIF